MKFYNAPDAEIIMMRAADIIAASQEEEDLDDIANAPSEWFPK